MYKLTSSGVLLIEERLFITENPNDKNWKQYLKWLEVPGNIPEPMYTKDEAYFKMTTDVQSLSASKQFRTFDYLGNTFSLSKLNKIIKDKTADKTKTFKIATVDNQIISFDKTEYKLFGDAMIDAVDIIEDQEVAHMEALGLIYQDALSTADDLLNYDIQQGW